MRTVFCKKYLQELEGLEKAPFPGPKGEEIFQGVSKKAWLDWQSLQTMLINEKHLSMAKMEDRKYLMLQMDLFFQGKDHDKPTGYKPAP